MQLHTCTYWIPSNVEIKLPQADSFTHDPGRS